MKSYNIMAQTEQEQSIDETLKEMTKHYDYSFPCSAYIDNYVSNACLWHWHDEFEIAYVQEGMITVYVNDKEYTLQQGEGIFVNSGILHSYSGKDTRTILPNIVFMPSLIYGSKDSIFWTEYVRPLINSVNLTHIILSDKTEWQSQMTDDIKKVISMLKEREKGYEFKVRSYLSDAVLKICQNSSLEASESSCNNIAIERIRKMLSFINTHYMEPIQLSEISQSAFISKRECLRLFKNIIGISPKQYLIQMRLQNAEKMLLETTCSITEICITCGFQDQSYFTKTFRKQFGIAPGKYRKIHL